jgi:hypothetical protein
MDWIGIVGCMPLAQMALIEGAVFLFALVIAGVLARQWQ